VNERQPSSEATRARLERKGESNFSDLTLSVVIPALDEEDGIRDVAERVLSTRAELAQLGIGGLEVIVVDDGSSDRTCEIVSTTPGATLVRHPSNRGYGAAIKTGFHHAQGQLLAFLDADGTYPPERLPALCARLLQENADIAVGSRRSGSEASDMPYVRRLGNTIWSSLLTMIGSENVQDPASGMRVVRRGCLERLYPLPDGLNFTPVMSTRTLHEDLRLVEVAIPYHERAGRSKLSVVRDGLRFLGTILWTAVQYNPARLLEWAGGAAVLTAALIWVVLAAARAAGVDELDSAGVFVVCASLVLSVGGVSMASLGIVFNRLVSLFHRSPIRQRSLAFGALGSALEGRFGWVGLAFTALGSALAVASMAMSLGGWEMTRLWFWLLASASTLLVGVHLLLFWGLLHILSTLDDRPERIVRDFASGRLTAWDALGAAEPDGETAL